jgi:predicted small metal-binding protein
MELHAPRWRLACANLITEAEMKRYDCLVPGCAWHTEANDTAEIVRRAAEHMRNTHEEAIIRPEMVEHIKARIEDGAAMR